MVRHTLSIFASTALVAAAAITPAAAQCCGCAYTCAPPAQVQIWGVQPGYVVNQGPVYSGPGFYTSPTFEGETLTVDYPGVGYHDPFNRGPYDPFRHQLYNPYWPHLPPEHGPFRTLHRSAALSSSPQWGAHRYRGYRDPSLRY